MRDRLFGLLTAIVVTGGVGSANASFVPHLTPPEQQRYQEMLKADPAAAHAYIHTRNFVSICQQALGQPSRVLEMPIEPKDYDEKFVTPDEVKSVKSAIFLWMKATISH
jgi:hypothetical protein